MDTYKIAKKYTYSCEYYYLNEGIEFLKRQVDFFKSKSNVQIIDIFKKIYVQLNGLSFDDAEASIIKNDINTFIIEYEKAQKLLFKDYNIYSKGLKGEDKVANILYSYNDLQVLKNVTLNYKGNSIENDFIVLANEGIFVLEVKNWGNGSQCLRIDNLGRIVRIKMSTQEILESSDVIEQNNRHKAYLSNYLKENFKFDIPIIAINVIVSNIKLINDSEFLFLGPNQIYSTIKSYPKVLGNKHILDIKKFLIGNSIDSSKYSYINYAKSISKNMNLLKNEINEYLNK